MDQRVSFPEGEPPYLAMTAEAESWMPPVVPLAMPRQSLERGGLLAGLADLARAILQRRKA